MGDKVVFANRFKEIETVLTGGRGLRKEKRNGGVLTTVHEANVAPAGMDQRIDALLETMRSGEGLSENEARELVWIIDLLAVAMPDNYAVDWSPTVLKLASTLRQDFAKAFGKKAYAS